MPQGPTAQRKSVALQSDKLSDLTDVFAFLHRPFPMMLLRRVQELIWTIRPIRSRLTKTKDRGGQRDGAPGPGKAIAPKAVSFSCIVACRGVAGAKAQLRRLERQGKRLRETILWVPDSVTLPNIRRAAPQCLAEENLAAALQVAKGDFVIIFDESDKLLDGGLDTLAAALDDAALDLIYSDERQSGTGISQPVQCLKPGWSPELLESFDYFGRPTAIRRVVAVQALGRDCPPRRSTLAAEWDLHLRVVKRTKAIDRIQRTLCERVSSGLRDKRCANEEEEEECAEVLRDYWQRQGLKAEVVAQADGSFRSDWQLPVEPLVSVVIPNRDKADLLRVCVEGLHARTSYRNIELIIVDNRSTEPATLSLYADLIAKGAHIVKHNEAFNYSRACNIGAAVAHGDFLLFLNNDMEVLSSDWLTHLVRAAMRPGVGVVGAELVYPDGEIQHAGVVVGLFVLAAHIFHKAKNQWGPFGGPDIPRNWSAVTGACQLVSRSVFDLVGHYDETFQIAYSDVVFCLDAGKFGYRTVYQPQSKLIHHEGKTRGFENPTYDQLIFARRLRALGITTDPYFHARLDPFAFIPTLRGLSAEDRSRPTLQADIEDLTAADPIPSTLDIFNDGSLASAVERDWDKIVLPPPAFNPETPEDMAQVLINLIRRRADLRRRFPHALSDGPTGEFACWVKGPGLRSLGLDPDRGSLIDAAFKAHFDAPARQILLYDEALRTHEPLILLPSGRRAACRVLFQAADDGRLRGVQVWWFLLITAEDPVRELHATWSIRPDWQAAVPWGGSVFGTIELRRWVASTFDIRQDWLFEQSVPPSPNPAAQVRLAYEAMPSWQTAFPRVLDRADDAANMLASLSTNSQVSFLARNWLATRDIGSLASQISCPGVNILGHFSYPSGLRVSTESIVASLHGEGVATSLRDVPVGLEYDEPLATAFDGSEIYDVTILHVQPTPFFDQVYERAGLLPRPRRTYRIGFWYWELDTIPSEWDRLALDCDEIWTATSFVAEALRKRYRQPVEVFLPGVELPDFEALPRSHFKLENGVFVFLFIFHMRSIMERKNPLALINAFALAFKPSDNVHLVIKTMSGEDAPEDFSMLQAAVADTANISIVNEVYSREETLSLMACCDAYVSLHRSEGFGLTMAEAMLLGRPVVATRYSGNVDFMDDNNSLLVDYTLTTIDKPVPPYEAGQQWAAPSVAEAAAQMRRLYDDPEAARTLGARAKADLENRLSHRSAGKRMKARLDALRTGRLT